MQGATQQVLLPKGCFSENKYRAQLADISVKTGIIFYNMNGFLDYILKKEGRYNNKPGSVDVAINLRSILL